ncbi:hypothetical protein D3C81_2058940 [compost metagenome]
MRAEIAQRFQLSAARSGNASACHKGKNDQIPRLVAVDVLKLLQIGKPLLAFHIGNLSSDHPSRTCHFCQVLHNRKHMFC